jgi:polyhydroxybutyrate depolymerase
MKPSLCVPLPGLFAVAFMAVSACSSESPSPTTGGGNPSNGDGGPVVSAGDGSTSDGRPLEDGSSDAGSEGATKLDDVVVGGSRPVKVHVPAGYRTGTPAPLVVLLHGYSSSALETEAYVKLTALADARGFLYAAPDGSVDAAGNRFWNATDACCDVAGTGVDDSAYLRGVIDAIKERLSVDTKRVFIVGHSNGGFMAYRMACDHADAIAAVVSVAGAMVANRSLCQPSHPVSILQIHGTEDETIAYDGGENFGVPYPSAKQTVADWVSLNGCSEVADGTPPTKDLDTTVAGNETSVQRFGQGCRPGGHAELWSMVGAGHIPAISPGFSAAIVEFLFAHPRP